MNEENAPDKDPRKWLEGVDSDLAIARGGKVLENLRYEELCYHCEQAIEKSLKALMVQKFNNYEWGHNLDELIIYLENNGISIPLEVKDAVTSSIDYGGFQFPFEFPLSFEKADTSLSDLEKSRYPPQKHKRSMNAVAYTKALKRAEIVVSWVKQQL